MQTAKGKYVKEVVRTMQQIVRSAESHASSHPVPSRTPFAPDSPSSFNSVAAAAVKAAESSGAKCIIVLTKTGRTARLISSHRPGVPIVCYTGSYKVGRQLQVHRGCHPVVGLAHLDIKERSPEAVRLSRDVGFLDEGDTFVMVSAEHGEMGVGGGAAMLAMKVGVA